ncbi:MAG: magnesium or manganese-dependent protein phosphatase, partial [Acidimicrobiales bacterium]|nr:magnesium or manganese-dependent protein phosphatase [Acidimicrobiales bacterium]
MPTPAADTLPSELPTRVVHHVRAALIALVVVIGVTATAVEWHQGGQSAHRNDVAMSRRAVDLVMTTAASTQAGLAGAGGLVRADGSVDLQAFAAYASEVTARSALTALAYEPVVPEAARARYEQAAGGPITDRASDGSFVPAATRAEHYPVRIVVPASSTTHVLLGFDLAGDPVRRAAAAEARDTGNVVFTAPTASQPSGTISFFIVKPLYRLGLPVGTEAQRRAALAGFISTASVGTALVQDLQAALPPGTRFDLRDGGTVLAASRPAPKGGVTQTVRAANRTWTLLVDGPGKADHGIALLLALLTALVAGGLGYVMERSLRHDHELRRSAELIAHTADLAQSLSAADTVEEVTRIIQEQLSTVLGTPGDTAATSIGVIEGDRLRVMHGPTVPEEYRTRFGAPALSSDLAFTEAARTGQVLLFETQAAYSSRYPAAGGPDVGARAVLPLRRANGTTIGAMAHLWPGPLEFDPALVSTLNTIAQLTGQAIERTRLAQIQAEDARHTKGLARLAQGLASRTNSDAVMTFLTQGVLAPLDAFHAAVGVVDGPVLRRHFTPGELSDLVAASLSADTPLQADSPLTQVARLGEPVLLADEAALRAGYPHLVEAWLAVGFGATANLPLRDRQGNIIGALGVAWDHPVAFDADLRDRLSTVAGIAGQTLERAQLVDRIRGEARGSEALAELAEVLATARSSEEVAAATVSHAAKVVGADGADVAVLDPATGQLRMGDTLIERGAVLPHADVMTSGGTLTFP